MESFNFHKFFSSSSVTIHSLELHTQNLPVSKLQRGGGRCAPRRCCHGGWSKNGGFALNALAKGSRVHSPTIVIIVIVTRNGRSQQIGQAQIRGKGQGGGGGGWLIALGGTRRQQGTGCLGITALAAVLGETKRLGILVSFQLHHDDILGRKGMTGSNKAQGVYRE